MVKCKINEVEKDVCYILFKSDKSIKHKELGFTNRKEKINVDFNKDGFIIGFELLSSKEAIKPCQEVLKNDL